MSERPSLYNNQHGFRKDKSTSSAIFGALRDLYENWNTRLISTCVFIDFSRAFDSIDHDIFLRKLKLYGLSENCIKFLSSYIGNRTQATYVNGFKSPDATLECGTAQSSILGPLFYILYVNDIFSYVKYNKGVTMYADDTLLMAQGETHEASIQACQESLNQIVSWCKLNRLTMNTDKTKSMSVCQNPKESNIGNILNISGKQLQHVHKYEYLGVLIDEKLGMNDHIEHITKKVQAKLCTSRKLRRHVSEATALKIYKTLIMCHMDYGDFVIDSGIKANIDRLDRLQTRTIRCIEYQLDRTKRRDLNMLYKRYKLEPLESRRKRNLVKLMYSESKNPLNRDNYRPKIVLRSSKSVKMSHKFTRLTKIQKSPYYRGLELWDKLPQDIHKIESKIEFKNKIRTIPFI